MSEKNVEKRIVMTNLAVKDPMKKSRYPRTIVKVIPPKVKSNAETVIIDTEPFKPIDPVLLERSIEATRHIKIAPYSEVKENLDRAAKKTIFGISNES